MLLSIYFVTAMMHSNYMASELSLTRHFTVFSKWLLLSVIWKPSSWRSRLQQASLHPTFLYSIAIPWAIYLFLHF